MIFYSLSGGTLRQTLWAYKVRTFVLMSLNTMIDGMMVDETQGIPITVSSYREDVTDDWILEQFVLAIDRLASRSDVRWWIARAGTKPRAILLGEVREAL